MPNSARRELGGCCGGSRDVVILVLTGKGRLDVADCAEKGKKGRVEGALVGSARGMQLGRALTAPVKLLASFYRGEGLLEITHFRTVSSNPAKEGPKAAALDEELAKSLGDDFKPRCSLRWLSSTSKRH